ncbi:SAM-dependent methyltransferase [Actinomycetospora endophytica]|uniref:SAM-dependent methyltransferase n=1 Tax=Actinomycetospora endophytica TaxID=2291215 RepID=A0ABS8PAZ7_9PSEU|nr:SAM-dependent methyltransferase [Actinomycetospora endophytica]MCD2195445.1 SAM-dependent methyltransferase [Actinomycetospora endophytica]
MVALLHFVTDDAAALVGRYRDALAPGSVVAMSHNSEDQDDPALAAALHGVAEAMRGSATELTLRTRAELAAFFAGLDLVPPGLVDVAEWPAPGAAAPVGVYGAAGIVPG